MSCEDGAVRPRAVFETGKVAPTRWDFFNGSEMRARVTGLAAVGIDDDRAALLLVFALFASLLACLLSLLLRRFSSFL